MGKVTFLGVEGAGKTVLTMALVNEFKKHLDGGWFLRPDSRDSFRFLEQVPPDFIVNDLPHQTTGLRHLSWKVFYKGTVQRELEVLDFPGEIYRLAFLDAKDEADPEGFSERVRANQNEIDTLLSHLLESDQIFVLFNPLDAEALGKNAQNLDAVWVTNACIDYLRKLSHQPNVSLVITQVDRLCDLERQKFDASIYLKQHLSLIANNFPDIEVFGISVIGKTSDSSKQDYDDIDVLATAPLGRNTTTYGLDKILQQCMSKTPVLKAYVESVEREVEQIKNIEAQIETIDLIDVSSVLRFRKMCAHQPERQNEDFWFINKNFHSSFGILSDINWVELDTIGSLLLSWRDGCRVSDDYMGALETLKLKLANLSIGTSFGQKIVNLLQEKIKETVDKQKIIKALREKIEVAKYGKTSETGDVKSEQGTEDAENSETKLPWLVCIIILLVVIGIIGVVRYKSSHTIQDIERIDGVTGNTTNWIDIVPPQLKYLLNCDLSLIGMANHSKPYCVASFEKDDIARAWGGTFSDVFYRDLDGNEYVYETTSEENEMMWLAKLRINGKVLIRASAEERPSNYIYHFKLYRVLKENNDFRKVYVREDNEKSYLANLRKKGQTFFEVVGRRLNGVEIWGGKDKYISFLGTTYEQENAINDDVLRRMGATDKKIEAGKRWVLEHVEKLSK